jgi:hypothetical protein
MGAAALIALLAAANPSGIRDGSLGRDPTPAQVPELPDQAKALRGTAVEEILAMGRAALPKLGIYRAKLTKQERIGSKLQSPQVLRIVVRETPLAIRMEFLEGPTGRKLIYDSATRPDELRVHEHGFLGIVGATWVSIHSSLVRGDSNHLVTEAGIGALLRLQAADMARAKPFGGFVRNDEGWNERGRWCVRYDAPSKASGLYATASRVCLDPATALPMEMTVWDGHGLLESYLYTELEPNLRDGNDQFDLKKAGL